jgi:hypothetical protein
MTDKKVAVNHEDICFHTAKAPRDCVEKRPIMEIVIVGVSLQQWYRVFRWRGSRGQAQEHKQTSTEWIHHSWMNSTA